MVINIILLLPIEAKELKIFSWLDMICSPAHLSFPFPLCGSLVWFMHLFTCPDSTFIVE